MRDHLPLLSAVLACALAVGTATQDPARDIKNKDPAVRLRAIEALQNDAPPANAEKLLLGALKDKDWGVRERAANALAVRGAKASIRPLVDVCLKGQTSRMRRAAAQALARIDATAAANALYKKVSGRTAVVACDALAVVWSRSDARAAEKQVKKLEKLSRTDEDSLREAAARAWLAGDPERAGTLKTLLANADLVVRAAALDLVTAAPRVADIPVLAEALGGPAQFGVIERRLERAALALVLAMEENTRSRAADQLLVATEKSGVPLGRRARLVATLTVAKVFDAKAALERIRPSLADSDSRTRAAAAKALRSVDDEASWHLALERFAAESEPRVRFQLLDTIVLLRGFEKTGHVTWVTDVLLKDSNERVREQAAVWLGTPKAAGAVHSLARAVEDRDWGVAVCAIVSLGKTGHEDALTTLASLVRDADWRLRGAAVVGLMHLNRKGVVEPLIAALEDDTPLVARSAFEALKHVSWRGDIAAQPAPWRAWWEKNGETHMFRDRREIAERRKKYGYSTPDNEIYDGLDVVVLQSRGDHIEELLDDMQIEHRKTQANHVAGCGLHPEAIFVVNCTGEIEAGDVDPISWFVRTGGYLFGSCWALNKTIELVYPGVIRKFETPRGEVLDDVRARPCTDGSDYLTNVFPDGVVPIYHLEGAHLIEVLDSERAEVLIDSPDAAQRHGGGNLAAWFQAGHGVILDSANHFDLQGLEVAPGLKKDQERQAYAVDHMGLTYDALREITKEKFWSSSPRAAQHVPDLSAFRFITNFVRVKRIGQR